MLQLLQLADSACPIGGIAHSWGLETLVVDGRLTVAHLEAMLHDLLIANGLLEAACCRAAHQLMMDDTFEDEWLALNLHLSARKPAREARLASATLGRRLLQLALDLSNDPRLERALHSSHQHGGDIHHSAAFGFIGGVLAWEADAAVQAYLHQSLAGMVSACQRLLPLGQRQASQIMWRLKPALLETVARSQQHTPDDVPNFSPLLDVGSMRHPGLSTRLFIS